MILHLRHLVTDERIHKPCYSANNIKYLVLHRRGEEIHNVKIRFIFYDYLC